MVTATANRSVLNLLRPLAHPGDVVHDSSSAAGEVGDVASQPARSIKTVQLALALTGPDELRDASVGADKGGWCVSFHASGVYL